MRTYATLLSSDSYLPGVLVLGKSLRLTSAQYPLLVMVTPDVSEKARELVNQNQHVLIAIDAIESPVTNAARPHWKHTFSKLNIFALTQFEKLVYLDADMLVCQNVDSLFDLPKWSAVRAGYRKNKNWLQLNSGLLVVEPNAKEFSNLLELVGRRAGSEETLGDQDILHQYKEEWPFETSLHLDETYNMFNYLLDEYHRECGIDCIRDISEIGNRQQDSHFVKVIHYIRPKPWQVDLAKIPHIGLFGVALRLWEQVEALTIKQVVK